MVSDSRNKYDKSTKNRLYFEVRAKKKKKKKSSLKKYKLYKIYSKTKFSPNYDHS